MADFAEDRVRTLSALLAPRSIAVVGASDTPTKIGGIPLDYQKRFGYAGALYPVNPRSATIQGLPAFESLAAIGQPVDLAIVALPAASVDAVLEDAVAAGVRSLLLFSSGFAEMGEDGARQQERLAARARAAGVRLLGPNCLGFINFAQQVVATFSPAPLGGLVRSGDIGLVSQSGAFGAYAFALARERGLGFSQWITTGNEADIDFADCVEWLAQDPATRVIMGYMEGCRDGARLRRALAAAHAARKPVVMVKVGRTPIGAQAASSHTAALAGDDAVYDAVLREYGVHRARDIAEFFGVAAALSIAGLPRDRSLGVFTVSGGVGVLMADEAEPAGLAMHPLPDAAQAQIREWVPFAAPMNPVDITGQVTNDLTLIERTADLMLRQGGYASWLGFLAAAGTSERFWPVLESLVDRLRAEHPQAVLAISTLLPPARQRALEARGCLYFAEPAEAVRTLGALATLAERQRIAVPGVPVALAPPPALATLSPGVLDEPAGLAVLAQSGLRTVPHRVVQDADAAVEAARALGLPVVLKIVSRDILHKSDVGGVLLGLADADAVRAGHARLLQNVAQKAPQARIDGMLVAPMLPTGGVECILGIQRDPVFGPMVMFGLGGVFVEVFGDIALRSAPVTEAQALDMMRSLRAWPLLDGARGRAPVDTALLAAQIAALSRLAAAAPGHLESIDINPFIALPAAQGGGCAADAVVVIRPPTAHSGESA
ncbi:MAG: acetate--CoA ligase family protein [Rhodoferax sp.]